MANTLKGRAAAASALNHYRRELGGQGDGMSSDAIDLIADLLLEFEKNVAEHVLEQAVDAYRSDREMPPTVS